MKLAIPGPYHFPKISRPFIRSQKHPDSSSVTLHICRNAISLKKHPAAVHDSIIERPEVLVETWSAHRSHSSEGAQHSHVSPRVRPCHLYLTFRRQYFHVFTLTRQGSY